ncbi:hypothetical protein [Microbulbifer variabilis]|uniref:hypothetical protein n=1 Tax=Microbulbifer variabilis TaxID=266805 RepID=UPI001CFC4D56|nr:hypothetical protein [Microbulbifer variabilis]
MAGHYLLRQTHEKTSVITVGGSNYTIQVSYHDVAGITGKAVGIKFTNASGSMDSSVMGKTNGLSLARAIGTRATEMILPDLPSISIVGFYLLTDDLGRRKANAIHIKNRAYGHGAREIYKHLKHKLPHFIALHTDGGIGWFMSDVKISETDQYRIFEQELAKPLEVLPC